jgi:N-acetylneuraminic acid mutarotase/DNA-binding beta-propeller fold protein YncE
MKPRAAVLGVVALSLFCPAALNGAWPAPTMIAWWESTPAPEPRAGYASGVIGGKLLLIGGTYWEGTKGNWTKKIWSAAVHAFDPVKQTWERLPDAPVTLGYAASAQVGEEIFALGGVQNGQPSRDVWRLRKSGARYAWDRYGQLPAPRLFASAVSAGKRLYLLGGTSKFEPYDAKGTCCTSTTATNTLWVLDTGDPSRGWKPLAPYPGDLRWGQQAETDGAAVYMFGGSYQAAQQDTVRHFNEVLRYDLAAGQWARVADLPEEMQGAAPTLVHGRIILVASGKKVMLFDPKTARFSPLDPLPQSASVDRFVWIDPLLVGASGENSVEGPRRRSEWTFLGRVSEVLPPLPDGPAPFAKETAWPKLPSGFAFSSKVSNVAADSKGRIYVADRGPHPLKVLGPSGELLGTVGDDVILPSVYYDLRQSPPVPMERRPWVHGLHVDHADSVWVTDVGRHVVMKFSPQGQLLLTLGTLDQAGETSTLFNQPTSVVVAPAGDIFVADGYGNSRIVKFDARGKFVKTWGKLGIQPGEFHTPHCLAMDSSGRLYVTDRENHRIQIFDQEGRFLEQWPNLHSIDAIFIAKDDRVYLGAGVDDRIYRVDAHGRIMEQWGNDRTFGYPHGICFDRSGNLYVAQTGAGRADKFRPVQAAR